MGAPDIDIQGLRLPPQSIEAEQSVLGCLLLDPSAYARIADDLSAADFYRAEHRTVYAAIAAASDAGQSADVVTLHAHLSAAGRLDDAGGEKYLQGLAWCVTSAARVVDYARIVRERSLLRQTIAASDEIAADAFKAEAAAPVVERGLEAFTRIGQGLDARRRPQPLRAIVGACIDVVQARADGSAQSGWSIGLPSIDRALCGGLRPGHVYVLAARPSVGKSSLAQWIGLRLAGEGITTLMLSQEMPAEECGMRALAATGRGDYGALMSGHLRDEDWERMVDGSERAASLPYWVDDQPGLRLVDVRAKARSVDGLQALIVDYVQLCESDDPRASNRNLEVEAISRGLKRLAKEQGLAVILLSQLNREVEKRSGGEPVLADLRDSGAIEQDADAVLFLWSIGDEAASIRTIGAKLAKNRQGSKARVALAFDGRTQTWDEATVDVDTAMREVAQAKRASRSDL